MSILISFAVVFFSTPLLRKLAVGYNILDVPDHRKPHQVAVPLLGGVAIYAGIATGLLINQASFYMFSGLLLGGTLILLVGVMDDIFGVSSRIRLTVQVIAAFTIIAFGYRIDFLPDTVLGNAGEIVLTLIWIIGITNAVNYMDGLDGLAAGMIAVISHCFAIIAFFSGQYQISTLSWILAAVCIGFIPYNLRREKIFLGDAGSTFIGFTLAGIAVIGHWASDNVIRLSVPILLLGVPIFDMVFTTIMRIKEKKVSTIVEWFDYAGKDHFHHRLIDLGLRSRSAVIFIYFITVVLGISAIIISQTDDTLLGILAILQGIIIFGAIGVLMIVGARRRSGWDLSYKEGRDEQATPAKAAFLKPFNNGDPDNTPESGDIVPLDDITSTGQSG
jgi:UDP-GlcNAc:undecaprenyl-phosphate GlcNAc-1-phosphate transferase